MTKTPKPSTRHARLNTKLLFDQIDAHLQFISLIKPYGKQNTAQAQKGAQEKR